MNGVTILLDQNTFVLKENEVEKHLINKYRGEYIILTEEEIDLLAEKIDVFSRVEDSVKAAHIKNIS